MEEPASKSYQSRKTVQEFFKIYDLSPNSYQEFLCFLEHPSFETFEVNFKDDLFKMKLSDLKNPTYFVSNGSVLIQVESQVVSRFRLNEETYTGFLEFTRRNCGLK